MLSRIEQLLRARIGLDSASVGPTLIERNVRRRMKACGVTTLADYAALLEKSEAELDELIETVVVPETWFFRDREAFAALVRLVRDQLRIGDCGLRNSNPKSEVRILSLPCSTGEEAYTVAMALSDAGVPAARYEIWGVDVSVAALARALRGLYGKNSFRTKDLGFRARHFQATKEEGASEGRGACYLIHEALRQRITFQRGNLLEEPVDSSKLIVDSQPRSSTLDSRPSTIHWSRPGQYDYIFCRNLLIYFDRPTQARAVQKLQQLLAPGGVCFVGAAELPIAMSNGFVSANLPLAFACHKKAESHPSSAGHRPAKEDGKENRVNSSKLIVDGTSGRAEGDKGARGVAGGVKGGMGVSTINYQLSTKQPQRRTSTELEEAQRLANAGRIEEAATLCRRIVESHRPEGEREGAGGGKGNRGVTKARGAWGDSPLDPQASIPDLCGAYYLLGVVHDAKGEGEHAEDYYRKALYLEPNHYEALMQLALQKERNGDTAGARVLRRRAERTGQTNGVKT